MSGWRPPLRWGNEAALRTLVPACSLAIVGAAESQSGNRDDAFSHLIRKPGCGVLFFTGSSKAAAIGIYRTPTVGWFYVRNPIDRQA